MHINNHFLRNEGFAFRSCSLPAPFLKICLVLLLPWMFVLQLLLWLISTRFHCSVSDHSVLLTWTWPAAVTCDWGMTWTDYTLRMHKNYLALVCFGCVGLHSVSALIMVLKSYIPHSFTCMLAPSTSSWHSAHQHWLRDAAIAGTLKNSVYDSVNSFPALIGRVLWRNLQGGNIILVYGCVSCCETSKSCDLIFVMLEMLVCLVEAYHQSQQDFGWIYWQKSLVWSFLSKSVCNR